MGETISQKILAAMQAENILSGELINGKLDWSWARCHGPRLIF
jgi:hypothetical protein